MLYNSFIYGLKHRYGVLEKSKKGKIGQALPNKVNESRRILEWARMRPRGGAGKQLGNAH